MNAYSSVPLQIESDNCQPCGLKRHIFNLWNLCVPRVIGTTLFGGWEILLLALQHPTVNQRRRPTPRPESSQVRPLRPLREGCSGAGRGVAGRGVCSATSASGSSEISRHLRTAAVGVCAFSRLLLLQVRGTPACLGRTVILMLRLASRERRALCVRWEQRD